MIVNGVTLPDIPAEAKDYSHFLVFASPNEDGSKNYMLIGFSGECLVVKDTSPLDPTMPDVYPYWMYLPKPVILYETVRDGEWVYDSEATGTGYQKMSIPCMTIEMGGAVEEYNIFWADHVIMEATLDDSGVPVSTGVQYYPTEVKPDRVSIGRSLVDGFATQVQRLTGTTDQMNAVQIQEKLSAVKAGIKIGDVVLPDIPEDVLAEYPYVFITYMSNVSYSQYMLMASASKSYRANGILFDETDTTDSTGNLDAGVLYFMSENAWSKGMDVTAGSFFMPNGSLESSTYTVVWANHDIYEATAIDTSARTITSGEVYFSERQNFNGVWLPKIPDGFFDEKPNGILFRLDTTQNGNTTSQYFLMHDQSGFMFFPAAITGQDSLVFTAGEIPLYMNITNGATEWSEGTASEGFYPMGQYGDMYYYELLWANHDIYECTIDGNAPVSTDVLYFPPLPAIDTDRVSIGYDLFDGIVQDVQQLSGSTEKMNALRAYWKLTTVTAQP